MSGHELSFSQKDNLPDRDPHEFYATPDAVIRICNDILYRYLASHALVPDVMIDVGADRAQWASDWESQNALMRPQSVIALEYRDVEPLPHFKGTYFLQDIRDTKRLTHILRLYGGLRVAFGNPPYFKKVSEMDSMMTYFLWQCRIVAFLLRNDFQSGQARYQQLFGQGQAAAIISISNRFNFEGRGSANYRNYAFYIWDNLHHPALPCYHFWCDSKQQLLDPRLVFTYPLSTREKEQAYERIRDSGFKNPDREGDRSPHRGG